MPADAALAGWLGQLSRMIPAFMLLIVRLGSIFVFLPMPGSKGAPALAKSLVVLTLAASLTPSLALHRPPSIDAPQLVLLMLGEAALGLIIGLLAAWATEALVMAAQMLALPAGYAFASAFDPSTEADSGVLQILAQLTGSLLFFATGMDALVLKAVARSLDSWDSLRVFDLTGWDQILIRAGSYALELAVRLALPVAGLLLLSDLTLSLLGRMQSELQFLSLSFPLKMLATLLLLAALAPAMAHIYSLAQTDAAHSLRGLFG